MREETRKKLERQLMLERLKWVGAGVGVLACVAVLMWWSGLDASVETRQVAGVVEAINPVNATAVGQVETALAVDVKLEDGRHAQVITLKSKSPKVGDHVQIAEHVHGTGRVTFSWK